MSSMYRAAQKLYTSATAPSKKQKAKQEGWRVENLAAAPSQPPQEDDVVVLQAAHEAYVAVDVAAPSRGGGDTNGAFARQPSCLAFCFFEGAVADVYSFCAARYIEDIILFPPAYRGCCDV